MSKISNELNQIWHEQDGAQIKIGFTSSFLDMLSECWHILPANTKSIKLRAPLMMLETNDGLVSIISPVAGNIRSWNDRASNMPDKLSADDVIMVLTSEKVGPKARPADQLELLLRQQRDATRRLLGDPVPPMQATDWNMINTGNIGNAAATTFNTTGVFQHTDDFVRATPVNTIPRDALRATGVGTLNDLSRAGNTAAQAELIRRGLPVPPRNGPAARPPRQPF